MFSPVDSSNFMIIFRIFVIIIAASAPNIYSAEVYSFPFPASREITLVKLRDKNNLTSQTA